MPYPVLLDATPLARGHAGRGIGAAVRGLLEHLPPAYRPTILTVPGQVPPGPYATQHFPWPNWPTHHIPDPWPTLRLHDALRKLKPRLFHATQPELTPDPRETPTIVTCYDLTPLHQPMRNPLHRHAYATYLHRLGHAKHIIAISHATADDLTRQLGIPAGRIRVVHLATPDAPPPHGPTPDRPYLLYANSIEPHKNPGLPLDAAARVPGIDLVMTGTWSPRRLARLKAHAADVGVADRVHWLGHVPAAHLAALRRDAVAVLVPSRLEGFGFPVLEALAGGVPALAADIPALREAGGDVATYLPPDDPDAWADAILSLHANPDTRADIARRGPAHAAAFTWDATARGTIDAWKAALADG